MPKGPAGGAFSAGADGASLAKASKRPDAAWQLIRFLASSEAATMFVTRTPRLPVRRADSDLWFRSSMVAALGKDIGAFTRGLADAYGPILFGHNSAVYQTIDSTFLIPVYRDQSVAFEAGLSSLMERVKVALGRR